MKNAVSSWRTFFSLEANSFDVLTRNASEDDRHLQNKEANWLLAHNVIIRFLLWAPNFPSFITTRKPSSSFSCSATFLPTNMRCPKIASSSAEALDSEAIGFLGMTRKCTGACGATSLKATHCVRKNSWINLTWSEKKPQLRKVA